MINSQNPSTRLRMIKRCGLDHNIYDLVTKQINIPSAQLYYEIVMEQLANLKQPEFQIQQSSQALNIRDNLSKIKSQKQALEIKLRKIQQEQTSKQIIQQQKIQITKQKDLNSRLNSFKSMAKHNSLRIPTINNQQFQTEGIIINKSNINKNLQKKRLCRNDILDNRSDRQYFNNFNNKRIKTSEQDKRKKQILFFDLHKFKKKNQKKKQQNINDRWAVILKNRCVGRIKF